MDTNETLSVKARVSWLEMNPVIRGELIRLVLEDELPCPAICQSVRQNVVADAQIQN